MAIVLFLSMIICDSPHTLGIFLKNSTTSSVFLQLSSIHRIAMLRIIPEPEFSKVAEALDNARSASLIHPNQMVEFMRNSYHNFE